MTTAYRTQAARAWNEIENEAHDVGMDLWHNPEPCLLEKRSSAVLRDWLSSHGFRVRDSASDCPTAFIAEAGQGFPRVGLLLEYDALPALSNVAAAKRERIGSRASAGHGCGHNWIGSVNAGAGIAASRALSESNSEGSLVLFGTPAEEILFGKVAMLASGDFDDVDVLLTHHPAYETAVLSRPTQSMLHGEFAFFGTPAHTGTPVARNALDAAELSIQAIERLRAHRFSDTSLEHTLRFPMPVMPSNTPEEVRCWWYVRHQDYGVAQDAYEWLIDISQQAAEECNVDFSSVDISACRGYLANDTLAKVLIQELRAVGIPQWDDAEVQLMSDIAAAFDASTPLSLHQDIELLTTGFDRYAQDDGELSWLIPLGRMNWAFPRNIPYHSWAATAFFGTEAAWRGAKVAGQTLSAAAMRLLTEPELVREAQEELRRRAPEPFERSAQGAWSELPKQAEAFWEGRWAPEAFSVSQLQEG